MSDLVTNWMWDKGEKSLVIGYSLMVQVQTFIQDRSSYNSSVLTCWDLVISVTMRTRCATVIVRSSGERWKLKLGRICWLLSAYKT